MSLVRFETEVEKRMRQRRGNLKCKRACILIIQPVRQYGSRTTPAKAWVGLIQTRLPDATQWTKALLHWVNSLSTAINKSE